jgi:CRISPR-associated protein Csm1
MELSKEQMRDYKTVVLAALFHDVGKFFQEGFGWGKNNLYRKQSAEFLVKGNKDIQWQGLKKWFPDKEMGIILNILADQPGDLKEETICEVIREADSLVRSEEYSDKNFVDQPLTSLFEDIGRKEKVKENYYYSFSKLEIDTVKPQKVASETIESDYKSHIECFIQELSKVIDLFNEPSIETIYHLFKKYLWCIPAPYAGTDNDISLFEHLKTKAAVAAILYKNISGLVPKQVGDAIVDRKSLRYSLILGDISGIQKFIYNITSKGASRGLKGRSFYLQLLTDAVSQFILHELGLTSANLLYSSGGKFYILSYALDRDFLKNRENQVNDFLFDKFDGFIYFALGKHNFPADALLEDFSATWTQVGLATAEEKRNKFRYLIESDYNRAFSPKGGGGKPAFCQVCGKDEEGIKEKDGIRKCNSCEKTENIGTDLRKFNYLGETINSKEKADVIFRFGDFSISYNIYSDISDKKTKDNTIYKINDTDFLELGVSCINRAFKFYGGNIAPTIRGDYIKTFDEIAKDSTGLKRLGILRMDVDNLGYIFQKGLPITKRTLPHITRLSFYFDMFFQGYINKIIKEKKDSVYVIYSGGDDLFVIGQWDVIVEMSIEIKNEFTLFTTSNPAITLSGGISLIGGKYPISRGAAMAGEAEGKAKSFREEKDAVTFLNKTLSWHDFMICKDIKDSILEIAADKDKKDIADNGKINKGIINRLKQVYVLYKKTEDEYLKDENVIKTAELEEKIFFNKWMWRMVYSFSRFAKDNPGKGNKIKELQKLLADDKDKDREIKSEQKIITYADIPARWAEFLLRKENKGGNE